MHTDTEDRMNPPGSCRKALEYAAGGKEYCFGGCGVFHRSCGCPHLSKYKRPRFQQAGRFSLFPPNTQKNPPIPESQGATKQWPVSYAQSDGWIGREKVSGQEPGFPQQNDKPYTDWAHCCICQYGNPRLPKEFYGISVGNVHFLSKSKDPCPGKSASGCPVRPINSE